MAHSTPHSLAAAAGFVSPALSQRALMFGAIVAFHIVLVYLFASGLGSATLNVILPPLEAVFVKDPPKMDPPPPPPQGPTMERQPLVDLGPLPDINPESDPDAGRSLSGTITPDPAPVAPPVPARVEPIHLVGKHQLPNTEDYYPPSLIRQGIEGATVVNVCVDERGKRTGEPTVGQSSGNARLDEAALDVSRAGRYARSARGETFVANCYGFRIIFTMK